MVFRAVNTAHTRSDTSFEDISPSQTSTCVRLEYLERALERQSDWVERRRGDWNIQHSPNELAASSALRPTEYYLLTESVVRALKQSGGAESVDMDRLKHTASACALHALTTFAPDTLNAFNAAYYSSRGAFDEENRVACLFAANPIVNAGLCHLVQEQISSSCVRLKEIASGGRTERWKHFSDALEVGRTIDATVSDFSAQSLPKCLPHAANVTLAAQVHNLLRPAPFLARAERYDVILTTYGYDSVWLPGDLHLEKVAGKWFAATYRLAIPDWHPNHDRVVETFRDKRIEGKVSADDMRSIYVEEKYAEIDLANIKFGNIVDRAYRGAKTCSLNFAGGMIENIQSLFRRQLSNEGVMIIGDIAAHPSGNDVAMNSYETTGLAGKFRIDDYAVTASALTSAGLYVEVLQLPRLLEEKCSPEIMGALATLGDHYVMVIKRDRFG